MPANVQHPHEAHYSKSVELFLANPAQRKTFLELFTQNKLPFYFSFYCFIILLANLRDIYAPYKREGHQSFSLRNLRFAGGSWIFAPNCPKDKLFKPLII